LTKKKFFSRF